MKKILIFLVLVIGVCFFNIKQGQAIVVMHDWCFILKTNGDGECTLANSAADKATCRTNSGIYFKSASQSQGICNITTLYCSQGLNTDCTTVGNNGEFGSCMVASGKLYDSSASKYYCGLPKFVIENGSCKTLNTFDEVDFYLIDKNEKIYTTPQECQNDISILGRDEYYVSWWIVTNDKNTDENEDPDEGDIHKAAVYTKNKDYATWAEIKDGFKNVTKILDSVDASQNAIFEGYVTGKATQMTPSWFNFGGVVDSIYPYKKISEEKFLLKREIRYLPDSGQNTYDYRVRYDLDNSDYYLYFMSMESKVVTKGTTVLPTNNGNGAEKAIKSTVSELTVPSGLSDLNRLGETNLQKLIGRFIRIVIGVIGTIALLMFVYGGLLWMTSAGNAEKTKKAMDIILWSSLGVIVILASYAIVNFVFGLL